MEKEKEKRRRSHPENRQRQFLYPLSPPQVKLKLCLWPQNWSLLLLPPGNDQKCLIEMVCSSVLWKKL